MKPEIITAALLLANPWLMAILCAGCMAKAGSEAIDKYYAEKEIAEEQAWTARVEAQRIATEKRIKEENSK